MDLQFLGTGGSQPIPLPTCDCRLCVEARERGAPAARRGYSMHLPGCDAVIDAPEQTLENLVRWGVDAVEYCLLTHWHPDHSGGLRALPMGPLDTRDGETFRDAKRRAAPTLVTTRAVYERARETVGVLGFHVDEGYVDTVFLDERAEPFDLGGITVEALPYPLADDESPSRATGFLLRESPTGAAAARDGETTPEVTGSDATTTDETRLDDESDASGADVTQTTLAIVPDDAARFDPARLPADLDAAVFECGYFTHDPDGERIRSPALETDDLSHEAVLERAATVDADRTFLSHVGHQYARSHAELRALAAAYRADPDRPDGVVFPHDGLTVSI